ncbi:hypothetical protein [Burkholderia sp. Ac-20392]|uniref:hypothetical protein n=1 Tax=Burkholderia sp. Ac-20392 TaxID=2703905 RepID=UPI00197CF676|nr:hypothetical protein [Burkholderia sp. Ac-20392]MBN3799473.1 hypothetical protein [Burkholderia sp. Ac-20392]
MAEKGTQKQDIAGINPCSDGHPDATAEARSDAYNTISFTKHFYQFSGLRKEYASQHTRGILFKSSISCL